MPTALRWRDARTVAAGVGIRLVRPLLSHERAVVLALVLDAVAPVESALSRRDAHAEFARGLGDLFGENFRAIGEFDGAHGPWSTAWARRDRRHIEERIAESREIHPCRRPFRLEPKEAARIHHGLSWARAMLEDAVRGKVAHERVLRAAVVSVARDHFVRHSTICSKGRM